MDECWLPGNWASCAGESLTRGAQDGLAKQMAEGFDQIFKDFATSWIGQGILVDLDGASVEWFKYSLSVVSVLLIVVGLVIAGARTAYLHRGEDFKSAMHALGRVLLVSTAGTLLVSVLVVGGDAFGTWILTSAGLDTQTFIVGAGIFALSPGLAIIFGLFGIIAVLCQWGIMLVRGALLPLLIGFWPTATAAAMTKGGEKSFEVVTKWILAFVIYSPLAACIYAFAWRLKSGDDGIGGVVNALILIVLAVAALPALMRVLGPVSAAMGKAAGGAMAAGITTAAVAAGVAIGAAVATGGASAAAGGGTAAAGGGTAAAGGGQTAAAGGGTGTTAGSGAGSESSSSAGGSETSGVGSSASGSESSSSAGGSSAGGSSSSSGGSDTAWRAAGAATEQGGNENNDGTAEGMVAE